MGITVVISRCIESSGQDIIVVMVVDEYGYTIVDKDI